MAEYYKVMNDAENHHGFQYQNGLNVLTEEFNDDPNDSCGPGGLYFTNKENLYRFLEYGSNIRRVSLPVGDPELKVVQDWNGYKWRANKLILEEKYSLDDPETYDLLGFDIKFNIFRKFYIIGNATRNGDIDTLNRWKKIISMLVIDMIDTQITLASQHGQTNALDWWKDNYNTHFKCTTNALDLASKNGHCNVLEWWKNSPFWSIVVYSNDAINNASKNGHVNVLEWWKNSGYVLQYSSLAIDYAFIYNNTDVIKWWKQSGLELKYSCTADEFNESTMSEIITKAIDMNDVDILLSYNRMISCIGGNRIYLNDTISRYQIMIYSKIREMINNIIQQGDIDTLSKCKNGVYVLAYDHFLISELIDIASANGQVVVLEWLKNNISCFHCTRDAIDKASENGHCNVLDWWNNNYIITMKYSRDAMYGASANGHVNVLEWWVKSGLSLKYSNYAMNIAIQREHTDVIDWWNKSGLELKQSTDINKS
jgi:hypothetical protein